MSRAYCLGVAGGTITNGNFLVFLFLAAEAGGLLSSFGNRHPRGWEETLSLNDPAAVENPAVC